MPRRNTHPFKGTFEGQQGMMSKPSSSLGFNTCWRDLNNFQRSSKFVDCGNDLCVAVVSGDNIDRAGTTRQ